MINLWNKTKKWSLNEFKENYQWLDVKFNVDFYESECSEGSKEISRNIMMKGYL